MFESLLSLGDKPHLASLTCLQDHARGGAGGCMNVMMLSSDGLPCLAMLQNTVQQCSAGRLPNLAILSDVATQRGNYPSKCPNLATLFSCVDGVGRRPFSSLALLGITSGAGVLRHLSELQQCVGTEHYARCRQLSGAAAAAAAPNLGGRASRPAQAGAKWPHTLSEQAWPRPARVAAPAAPPRVRWPNTLSAALWQRTYPSLAKLGSGEGRRNLRTLQSALPDAHFRACVAHDHPATSRPPYKRLELLGCAGQHESLGKLQSALGAAHLRRCAEHSQPSAGRLARMQGSAASALRRRNDDVTARESALLARERELEEREKKVTAAQEAAAATYGSPRRQAGLRPLAKAAVPDASGVAVDDEELAELFSTYDRDGSGFISREEFREEYRCFENYGLPLTDREIDRIFRSVQRGKADDRLSYDEFCILMLRRAKI